jgi:hypothetical protein
MNLDWLPLGHSPKRRIVVWPFYLTRSQMTMLRGMRKAWGEDCTIQIYSGCVRVQSERAYLRFFSRRELEVALRNAGRLPSGEAELSGPEAVADACPRNGRSVQNRPHGASALSKASLNQD